MTLPLRVENPFKRNDKGEIPSISTISRLCRDNPKIAEQLAREAGENPEIWMPKNPR